MKPRYDKMTLKNIVDGLFSVDRMYFTLVMASSSSGLIFLLKRLYKRECVKIFHSSRNLAVRPLFFGITSLLPLSKDLLEILSKWVDKKAEFIDFLKRKEQYFPFNFKYLASKEPFDVNCRGFLLKTHPKKMMLDIKTFFLYYRVSASNKKYLVG